MNKGNAVLSPAQIELILASEACPLLPIVSAGLIKDTSSSYKACPSHTSTTILATRLLSDD